MLKSCSSLLSSLLALGHPLVALAVGAPAAMPAMATDSGMVMNCGCVDDDAANQKMAKLDCVKTAAK